MTDRSLPRVLQQRNPIRVCIGRLLLSHWCLLVKHSCGQTNTNSNNSERGGVLIPNHDIEQHSQELIDNTHEGIRRSTYHSSTKPTSVTMNRRVRRPRGKEKESDALPDESSSDTREDDNHPSIGRNFSKCA